MDLRKERRWRDGVIAFVEGTGSVPFANEVLVSWQGGRWD
jgi:hypothetical protein